MTRVQSKHHKIVILYDSSYEAAKHVTAHCILKALFLYIDTQVSPSCPNLACIETALFTNSIGTIVHGIWDDRHILF